MILHYMYQQNRHLQQQSQDETYFICLFLFALIMQKKLRPNLDPESFVHDETLRAFYRKDSSRPSVSWEGWKQVVPVVLAIPNDMVQASSQAYPFWTLKL